MVSKIPRKKKKRFNIDLSSNLDNSAQPMKKEEVMSSKNSEKAQIIEEEPHESYQHLR